MNIYSIFPLIATIAYIPLLITVASSRPWQRRHTLFVLFLISAMLWSLIDYFFRSNQFADHNILLFKLIIIAFPLMAVQFHVFISTFYGQGRNRWVPFAYGSLAAIIVLVILGYIPEGIQVSGSKLYPIYGKYVFVVAIPLVVLTYRSVYVLRRRLRNLDNPVLYNQIVSLLVGIFSLTIFIVAAILPFGREYPISHFGNIINAFILSYAVIRHRLVDIRFVLRQGTAWLGLAVIGAVSFWLILVVLHSFFEFQLDLTASFVAVTASLVVAVFIYRVRGYFFDFMNRAFQGSSYNYRQKLTEFASKIHNVFSLKEQGGELISLIVQAIDIKKACLLFPQISGDDFKAQFADPQTEDNNLSAFTLGVNHPVVQYLEREQKLLSRENIAVLPSFLGMWLQEKEEIQSKEIEIFMPLISRDRLIAILVLGKKRSGRYTLADISLIEDVTAMVAVSMEKEYLREQLREREEELSVINSSSTILSSSLDIQEIFGSFIEELKTVIDVDWSSIVMVEDDDLTCVALSSAEGSDYQVGDKLPLEGTGTGWVVSNKKSFVESDLSLESHFNTGKSLSKRGLRTVVYIPLMAKGRVIGSFLVGSRQPHAYSSQNMQLLEQLASQIAMPLENSRLYIKAEKKARVDELTGLFNRRSLDEMIDTEISRHSRYGGVFSLAILDLDSFKAFNDTRGHLSGDKLLRKVGDVIGGAIRNADHAYRYGGDEFAILFPQTDIDAAFQVTERVRKKIAKDFNSGAIPITASIGLASWPDDGISHTDIIASADSTLYRAKRNGGNQSYCASGTLIPFQFSDAIDDIAHNIDDKILSVIYALAETVDSKSQFMHNHSRKVAEYALALAKSLKLAPTEMSKVEICALLHDIGKVGISDAILNKEGDLSPEEWDTVKAHTQVGAAIASRVPQLSGCVAGILHHHEWYDGTGYPDGLKGDDIPLEARILAVADAFTAMTSEKSYSKTITHQQALEELKRCAGSQYDPNLVEHFAAACGKTLIGTGKKARR